MIEQKVLPVINKSTINLPDLPRRLGSRRNEENLSYKILATDLSVYLKQPLKKIVPIAQMKM
jgi:hypothetical protein